MSDWTGEKGQLNVAGPRAVFSCWAVKPAVLALGILASFGVGAPGTAGTKNGEFLSTRGVTAPPSGASGICRSYAWACARDRVWGPVTREQLRTVRATNTRINRVVSPVADQQQYGVAEFWALPSTKGGDCEDYALIKKRELIQQGISPDRLLIATVLDRRRNPHAVLIFRSDQGDLVLDNLTNQIRTWEETRYFFLKMQNPDNPSSWVSVFQGA